MTLDEYSAAVRGGETVSHHADWCDAPKSLGFNPCDCGALASHLERRRAAEGKEP